MIRRSVDSPTRDLRIVRSASPVFASHRYDRPVLRHGQDALPGRMKRGMEREVGVIELEPLRPGRRIPNDHSA